MKLESAPELVAILNKSQSGVLLAHRFTLQVSREPEAGAIEAPDRGILIERLERMAEAVKKIGVPIISQSNAAKSLIIDSGTPEQIRQIFSLPEVGSATAASI